MYDKLHACGVPGNEYKTMAMEQQGMLSIRRLVLNVNKSF